MTNGPKHEKVVNKIKEELEKELGIEGRKDWKGPIYRVIPDLLFIIKDDHYLAIEVGLLLPEKIIRYRDDPNVKELRWYTKNCELVGQWTRVNKRNWVQNVSPKVGERIAAIKELDRKIEDRKKDLLKIRNEYDLFLKGRGFGVDIKKDRA